MIDILILLSPVLFLIIGLFFALGFLKEENKFLIITIFELIALISNTIILFLIDGYELHSYSLNINRGSYFISEFILITGMYIVLTIKPKLREISQDHIFLTFMFLLQISAYCLTITTNLIIILLLITIISISTLILGLFEKYTKDFFIYKKQIPIIIVSFLLMSFLIGYIYSITGSVNLFEISQMNLTLTFPIKISIVLLTIFGLGLPCGLVPFSTFEKEIYENGNFSLTVWIYTIQYPLFIIIIVKILSSLKIITNELSEGIDVYLGALLTLITIVGVIIGIIYSFFELFKKMNKEMCNIKSILGFQNIAQFNLVIMLFSLNQYTINNSIIRSNILLILLETLLIFILTNIILLVTLNPISKEDNLLNIEKIFLKPEQKYFGIGFIAIILMYALPGLFGFRILFNLIEIVSNNLISENLNQILGWTSIFIVFAFFVYIVVLYGIIFTKIFLNQKNKQLSTENQSNKKEILLGYVPLLSIVILILIIIILWSIYSTTILTVLEDLIIQLFY